MSTSKKRSSWLYLVLVVAILAFVGVSMVPLIGSLFENPTSIASTARGGVSLEEQDELAARAQGYQLVLEREPDNSTALRGLVEVRLEQGDLPGALKPLEALAELNTQESDYAILLAEGKQQLGEYQDALAAYDKVLAKDPGNVRALDGAIELQLQQNRPEAAISRLQDTLKISTQANLANPGSIDVTSIQLLLGKVYARQESWTEAIAVYDQAIESNPQDFRPFYAKASVLQEQGKNTEVQSLLSKAASLAPPKYKNQIEEQLAQLSAAESSESEADDNSSGETESDAPTTDS